MEQKELLYEGKAKQVYATDDPDVLIMHYKDDATAFNGVKHATIGNKGHLNNLISTLIFEKLMKQGIPTHYIGTINDRDQVVKKVTIFPLEVIVRNTIAGSMSKRLGIPEGTKPTNTIFEICYKNDELGDPLINDHHAVAVGAASYDELKVIYDLTSKVNDLLKDMMARIGLNLIDFKVEFGKTSKGEIVLADEISPDCMRLWDLKTNEHMDKDLFRRDLGDIIPAYQEVYNRLKALD